MSDFECPYCGEELEEPDCCDYNKEGEIYEYDCPICEKNFVFDLSYSIYYNTNKADCLNGGKHQWKKIIGVPEEYFKNKRRCESCNKEKIIT